jgi:uncharacterized phage protein (TIGR02220 family)
MREYAKVFPHIWIGRTGKEIKTLGIEAQLLSHYLITSPHANMIGIFYLPIALVAHETGMSEETVRTALNKLITIQFCSYDETMEYIWVHNMAFFQIARSLKANDNRVKNITDQLRTLPQLEFLSAFLQKYNHAFCLEDPSKPLLSQEQEQDQKQEQEQEQIYKSASTTTNILLENQSSSVRTEQAKQILSFLNEKTGKIHPATAFNLKLISDRLNNGATAKECFQIIAKKTRAWKGNEKMEGFLQPSTLFKPSKFDQYVSELVLTHHPENLQ